MSSWPSGPESSPFSRPACSPSSPVTSPWSRVSRRPSSRPARVLRSRRRDHVGGHDAADAPGHRSVRGRSFTVVFVALGAAASGVGQSLGFAQRDPHARERHRGDPPGDAFLLLGAVPGPVVGPDLGAAGPLGVRLTRITGERRFDVRPSTLGSWAAPVMGMAFAFAWTPCIGFRSTGRCPRAAGRAQTARLPGGRSAPLRLLARTRPCRSSSPGWPRPVSPSAIARARRGLLDTAEAVGWRAVLVAFRCVCSLTDQLGMDLDAVHDPCWTISA